MYALLAGCHNLGGTIASATGAWVLEVLEVQPSGAKDSWDRFKDVQGIMWLRSGRIVGYGLLREDHQVAGANISNRFSGHCRDAIA